MDAVSPPNTFKDRLAEFTARVDGTKAQLAEALSLAGFRRDPYRHIVEADVALIDLYPELLGLMEATRQPLDDMDITRLTDAAATGAERRAMAMAKAANRRTLTLAVLGAVAIAAGGAGAGYWFGRSSEAARYVQVPAQLGVALTRSDAAQWIDLIRLNDLGKSERVCAAQAGGLACSIALWVKPPTAKAN